jgi:hypothetical protein
MAALDQSVQSSFRLRSLRSFAANSSRIAKAKSTNPTENIQPEGLGNLAGGFFVYSAYFAVQNPKSVF